MEKICRSGGGVDLSLLDFRPFFFFFVYNLLLVSPLGS